MGHQMVVEELPKKIRFSTRRRAVVFGAVPLTVNTLMFMYYMLSGSPEAYWGYLLISLALSPVLLGATITSLFYAFCKNENDEWVLAARIVSVLNVLLSALYVLLWW